MMVDKKIYQKIFNVMSAVQYMPKDGKVEFGKTKYNYLSAEKIVENVRKEMIEQKLIIYPCLCSTDNTAGSEKDITMTYRILAIEDGSSIDVQVTGGGHDSTDKKSYKAMTGAYKYALRQTFMIETGTDDPDRTPSGKTQPGKTYGRKPAKKVDDMVNPKGLSQTDIKKLFMDYHNGNKTEAKEDYDLWKDMPEPTKSETLENMKEKAGEK